MGEKRKRGRVRSEEMEGCFLLLSPNVSPNERQKTPQKKKTLDTTKE